MVWLDKLLSDNDLKFDKTIVTTDGINFFVKIHLGDLSLYIVDKRIVGFKISKLMYQYIRWGGYKTTEFKKEWNMLVEKHITLNQLINNI